MTAEQLRNSILQEAISGRLTQSDTSDWREITIGQLGTVVTGTTPSKQNKEYYGDDYPFYKPSDLDAGIYTVKASDGLSKVGYEHARQLPANSILVTCIGATIGKTGLIKREGSCNQQINAIIPDADCDSRFIYYLMISPNVQEVIKYKSYSTTLPILNKTQFSQLEVTLPPLAEQKRIVAKLEELLPIVEQYGKAQKELDELNAALPARLRQSILQEAISGHLVPQDPNDEPASAHLARIREEKARLVKEGKLKKKDLVETPITEEEIPFEIPASWEWVRLGYLVDFSKSSSVKASSISPNAWILDLEDIQKNTGVLLRKKRMGETVSISDKHQFKKGNVLYSKLRPYLNKVIIADEDGYCTSEILCFNFGEINNRYAQLFLMSAFFVDYAMKDAYGVKMPRLGSKQGNNALFPLPPLAEQQRIVAKIEELFEQIDQIKK
jgi:type I restriction enzyme S subunit